MKSVEKFLPKFGKKVRFHPRSVMAKRRDRKGRTFKLPRSLPTPTLPIDWTNNGALSAPMDDNDTLGDCMYAMACHCDNAWTFGNGQAGWTESVFDDSIISQDYLTLSGGDNGLDEPTLLGSPSVPGSWEAGLCNNSQAIVVDSLDIDVTNVQLVQAAMSMGFFVCFMWSVPDSFIQNFNTGVVFDVPAIPDPANGHGTPFLGVDTNGNYRLYTWGTWCWITPAFAAAVQPSAFVVFSPRQFNSSGYDACGVHIATRAQQWQACGGNPIPASVISAFPPPDGPTPTPTPTPTPPAAQIVVNQDVPAGSYSLITEDQKAAIHGMLNQIAAALPSDSLAVVPAELRAKLAAKHLTFQNLLAVIAMLIAFIDAGDFTPAALQQLLAAIQALIGGAA